MTDDAAAIERLRQEAAQALRRGLVWRWGNREERGVLAYESGAFVERVYDQCGPDDQALETRTYSEGDALGRIAPWPESAAAWASVVRSLEPARRPPQVAKGPPVPGLDRGALVFDGALDGVAWAARAEALEDGYTLDGSVIVWPSIRMCVTTVLGTFRWRIPAPDTHAWAERGADGVREEVERRLARRLEHVRILAIDGAHPLPGGGTWTARHADRYEDDAVGCDIVATLPDGRVVELHHQLSEPDRLQPENARVAARSRLARWVRKQTR